MNKTHLGRGVATMATVLASLLAFASPAGADSITTGLLRFTNTGAPTATTPLIQGVGCTAGTFDMDVTGGTASITAMALTRRGNVITTPSVPFVAVITRTGGSTGTNSSGTLSGIGLSLNVTIYTLAATTTCTPDTRACEFNVTLTLSGTFTDGFFDTVSLNSTAASLTVVTPCDPPYTDYIGGTGHITSFFAVV